MPGTTQRGPISPSLSIELSWNQRNEEQSVISHLRAVGRLPPRSCAGEAHARQCSLLLGPPTPPQALPRGSQGSGWLAQPQIPLFSREVRSVLPYPPPIRTFCFCIFSEHNHNSGHQPASQHLLQHTLHGVDMKTQPSFAHGSEAFKNLTWVAIPSHR